MVFALPLLAIDLWTGLFYALYFLTPWLLTVGLFWTVFILGLSAAASETGQAGYQNHPIREVL